MPLPPYEKLLELLRFHRFLQQEHEKLFRDLEDIEYLALNLRFALPGDRVGALTELRDFTNKARSLILIDPYLFSGEAATANAITSDLSHSASLDGGMLRSVHFVYDSARVTNAIRESVLTDFIDRKVSVTETTTQLIHDRVWIADRTRALVVGTSFNGVGKRAAFMLPLP